MRIKKGWGIPKESASHRIYSSVCCWDSTNYIWVNYEKLGSTKFSYGALFFWHHVSDIFLHFRRTKPCTYLSHPNSYAFRRFAHNIQNCEHLPSKFTLFMRRITDMALLRRLCTAHIKQFTHHMRTIWNVTENVFGKLQPTRTTRLTRQRSAA